MIRFHELAGCLPTLVKRPIRLGPTYTAASSTLPKGNFYAPRQTNKITEFADYFMLLPSHKQGRE